MNKIKKYEENPTITSLLDRQINQLKLLFRLAYEGKANINQLYQIGSGIEKKIEKISPDYRDTAPLSLVDALDFIYGLHDNSSREYYSRNKEEIYSHYLNLS